MKVTARADGLRQYDTCSIYSLEYAKDIAPSGNFLDEYRSESFRAKLLMNT